MQSYLWDTTLACRVECPRRWRHTDWGYRLSRGRCDRYRSSTCRSMPREKKPVLLHGQLYPTTQTTQQARLSRPADLRDYPVAAHPVSRWSHRLTCSGAALGLGGLGEDEPEV